MSYKEHVQIFDNKSLSFYKKEKGHVQILINFENLGEFIKIKQKQSNHHFR